MQGASERMGGADGAGTRFGDCGKGPVIVKQACGADDDVLSDPSCGGKRNHLSIGLGAAAARWTTSPSGLEKFTPSRSDPGSEAGFGRFGSGVVSGRDSASFEGIFGPCRRMALPVGRRFCGGASSSLGFKIGDLDDIRRLRRRRCGGLRVWRVRLTWPRAPLFGSLPVTGW